MAGLQEAASHRPKNSVFSAQPVAFGLAGRNSAAFGSADAAHGSADRGLNIALLQKA
jgi:hypothetical protein